MAKEVKGTSKLLDVLKANITKKDDEKAIEAAGRQVKAAKKSATVELANLDEAVDQATDRVEALSNSATATLSQLMDANRSLDLATKNLETAQAIFDARF